MTTVFGRTAELAMIEKFASEVGRGSAALVIAGEAGIGKTTLWQAGLRSAESAGCRVLAARPSESEVTFSFAGLTDLLEPAAHLLPSLPPPQRRALEIVLLSAEDDRGNPVDHRTVAVAALSVVRLLAEERPLVLAIDDVQWLDPPTIPYCSSSPAAWGTTGPASCCLFAPGTRQATRCRWTAPFRPGLSTGSPSGR